MSLIRSIKIGLVADTGRFSSPIRDAIGDLDKLTESSRQAQAALGSLDTSKGRGGRSSAPSVEGSSSSADDMTSGAILGALRIRTAMQEALAPLGQIGATFSKQFDAVGGTITELSRRVDTALKYLVTESIQNVHRINNEASKGAGKKAMGPDFGKLASTGNPMTSLDKTTFDTPAKGLRSLLDLINRNRAANLQFLEERQKGNVIRLNKKDYQFGTEGDVAGKGLSKLTGARFDGAATSATRFKGALSTIAPVANTAATAVKGVGIQVALALGVFGLVYKATSAILGFFKSGISGAANLGETVSKTRAILGDSSAAVENYADKVADRFGLVKQEVLDAASSFGGLGKGLGNLKGQQLSDFSVRFTTLAADLQSFANTGSLAEASQALTIGLSGEQSDVLKRLGVIVNDTTVKQYALAHGIASTKGELSEQQKLAARAGIIQEKLADANGDLSKTFGSTKNAGRALGGSLTNLAVSVGGVLEPAIAGGISLLNQFALAGITAFNEYKPALATFASGVSEAFTTVGVIFRGFNMALEISQLKGREMFGNLILAMSVVPENMAIIGDYLASNWKKLLVDLVSSTKTMSDNIDKNMLGLFKGIQGFFKGEGFNFEWTPLLDGFQATAEKMPELMKPVWANMDDEIGKVGQRWADMEAARAKGPAGAAEKSPFLKVDGGDGSGAASDNKYKGTAAAKLGSAEANATLAKFRNGAGGDEPAKETAKNTKTTAETLKSIAESLTYMKNAKASGNAVSMAIASL